MEQVNIHAAKTHLSALVDKAAGGEPFIIAKAGQPLVMVIPYTGSAQSSPRVGFLKDNISVPADFDQMGQEDIAAVFKGRL